MSSLVVQVLERLDCGCRVGGEPDAVFEEANHQDLPALEDCRRLRIRVNDRVRDKARTGAVRAFDDGLV